MRPKIPIPADFEEHINEAVRANERRYNVHHSTIERWKADLGYPILHNKKARPILQYDTDGRFIRRYESVKEAVESMYGTRQTIHKALCGKIRYAYGFVWRYADDHVEGSI